MEIRDLKWHRAEMARVINFTSGTPDQDFAGPTNAPWANVDAAFNEAQTYERNLALIEGGESWAEKTLQQTWAASAVTFTLPEYMDRESVRMLYDVTNNSAGVPIQVTSRHIRGRVFWKDNRTLQWGTSGPGAAVTVEISYIGEAVALTEDAQEAALFPYNHRHLLNWSGACILMDMADQRIPQTWITRAAEYRSAFHLSIGRGIPLGSNVSRIRNHRVNY